MADHDKRKKATELSEEELKKVGGAGGDKEYKCGKCDKVFASREQLYAHKQATGHI